MINCMKYHDLRDFLALLEKQGELKRIRFLLIRIWK